MQRAMPPKRGRSAVAELRAGEEAAGAAAVPTAGPAAEKAVGEVAGKPHAPLTERTAATAAAAAPPAPGGADVPAVAAAEAPPLPALSTELSALAELRRNGEVTEEEFATAKRLVIGRHALTPQGPIGRLAQLGGDVVSTTPADTSRMLALTAVDAPGALVRDGSGTPLLPPSATPRQRQRDAGAGSALYKLTDDNLALMLQWLPPPSLHAVRAAGRRLDVAGAVVLRRLRMVFVVVRALGYKLRCGYGQNARFDSWRRRQLHGCFSAPLPSTGAAGLLRVLCSWLRAAGGVQDLSIFCGDSAVTGTAANELLEALCDLRALARLRFLLTTDACDGVPGSRAPFLPPPLARAFASCPIAELHVVDASAAGVACLCGILAADNTARARMRTLQLGMSQRGGMFASAIDALAGLLSLGTGLRRLHVGCPRLCAAGLRAAASRLDAASGPRARLTLHCYVGAAFVELPMDAVQDPLPWPRAQLQVVWTDERSQPVTGLFDA